MVVCGTKQYYLETSENEGEAICALREARTSMIWSHEGIEKRTMSDHGPEMSTVPLEAQSPITLSKMKQPRRILVTDMYNGYGEFTLLKGCEYVTLASLEIDSFLKNVTPASFECAPFLKPWVQDAMCALREAKMSTIWRHEGLEKCTMSDHGPVMRTVPLETQLLETFSKMKQSRRILVIDKYNGYGTSTLLKGCEYESLASLEIDSFLKSKTPASLEYVPFLKPWVQECLTSKLRTLLCHEIEREAYFDTLEKMHSSEAFDLVSGDVNKRDYKDYVEMLIARGLLDKNAMTAAYNKLHCGVLSALFESSFLEEKDPMTRSNTCKDRSQSTVLTPDVFLSCSSLSGPSNLSTSPKIRRRQSEQQSHEKFVGIENNTEVNDDVLEENYLTVYVKTINRKTISIRYYGNMIAAVMLEEVERRTMIPRDMTRLVHKGKAINGKKSMKENNIKANETIEMSLRLLGGMEANEHMDTHETEEDREKKRKLDGKRRNQLMTWLT